MAEAGKDMFKQMKKHLIRMKQRGYISGNRKEQSNSRRGTWRMTDTGKQ